MKMHLRAVLQFARGRKQREPHIQPARRAKSSRHNQRHAALHFVVVNAREIHGCPLPCRGPLNGFPAGLHAANAKAPASREELDFIFRGNAA